MNRLFVAIILSIFMTLYGYNYLFAIEGEPDVLKDAGLKEILSFVKGENLQIKSAKEKLKQSIAKKVQAKLLPNPELEAEFENFKGKGDFRDTNALEKTFSLSQMFELGNKRSLRYSIARFNEDIAGLEYGKVLQAVKAGVIKKYFYILREQERLKLIGNQIRFLKMVSVLSDKRKNAGKASQLEVIKVHLLLEEHGLKKKILTQRLNQLKRELSLFCNQRDNIFNNIIGDIQDIPKLLSKEELLEHLYENNDYLKLLLQEKKAQQQLKLSKTKILPDVTLKSGVRYFNETDANDRAFVAGISLPLPLFDRGQGEIKKQRSVAQEMIFRKESLDNLLNISFHNYYDELERLFEGISIMQDKILPLTKDAIDYAKDGFSKGRFNYLEVLDAYQAYYDTKYSLLDVLVEYYFLYIDFRIFLGIDL